MSRITQDKVLVEWIRRRAKDARRIASVCTGAYLLAKCGLLSGRRVVTHWDVCADLARFCPEAHVETDPIFIEDGRIWTSAGVTAGIDMTLALVERDLGHAAAMFVARSLVVFLKRPGGQSQFSTILRLQTGDDRFDRLHNWAVSNLQKDLSVPRLAEKVGMTERSFVRHYTKVVGHTPARAIEMLRVELARELLATTRISIKRVAQRCGFGSEETMRRGFMRLVGVPPRDYRQRFQNASGQSQSKAATARR